MAVLNIKGQIRKKKVGPNDLIGELTEWDQKAYLEIISTELTEEQKSRVLNPATCYKKQEAVLAIHWHPEFIPISLIKKRIDALFPNREKELIIPTQHNVFTSYSSYSGAEIDCHSKNFNRKVQLLLHFEKSKIVKTGVLVEMLAHTLKYRATQLREIIDSIIDKRFIHRLERAARITGTESDIVKFVQVKAKKLKGLLSRNESITPVEQIKNKLLSNYLDKDLIHYDDRIINNAQNLIKSVKRIVKDEFSLDYFYRTEEVIEEVRSIGGGIVVPHPEQFWPILLAECDVDGYEVWNPQSRQYTEFLIGVVNKQNRSLKRGQKPLLIFMGDDTHMSEKIKEPKLQNKEKSSREIGVQPAWDDLAICKNLIMADTDRLKIIDEYKERLG